MIILDDQLCENCMKYKKINLQTRTWEVNNQTKFWDELCKNWQSKYKKEGE